MPVTVLNVEMWVVTENGNYSAGVLPVPRGNVGQMGEGIVHTAKFPHHLSSSNCRIARADPLFS